MTKRLRKGLIVFNRATKLKGIVIDWGVKKKHRSYLPLPSYNRMAEAVRVATGSEVEIWPVTAIMAEEENNELGKSKSSAIL